MEICWDTFSAGEWDALAADDLPLQQAHGYGVAMAALGARVRRAVMVEGGRRVAMAQVLQRRGIRLISRGPVWLGPDAGLRRPALRALARWCGVTVATPGAAMAGPGLVPLVTPVHHALWRIVPDAAALRAGMTPTWRRTLQGVERTGIRIERADPHGKAVAVLLNMAAAEARAKGYRAFPRAFVAAWPGPLHAWIWRHRGKVAAGMIFLRHGPWASYHTAWANPAARSAGVHRPMLLRAALALAADGVRTLDLGTICDETAPGLALFKRGTGAAIAALGPTALVLP